MEKYTIRILNDEEFEKLPYKGISDSIGIADPETGDAFIRKTGIKEMDMATISHEIDELLANKSYHEDMYGIRHKKVFKDIIAPYVLPVIASAFAGPLGPLAAGLAGAGTSAIGQAATGRRVQALPTILSGVGGYLGGGAMQPGIAAAKAVPATAGYLGQVAGGVKGAIGSVLGKTAGVTGAIAPADAASKLALMGPGAGFQGAMPGAMGAGITPQFGPAISTALGSTIAAKAAAGAGAAAPTLTTLEKLATPSNLLGATAIGASMLPKTPEFQMPSSVEEIRGKLLAGGQLTPLGLQAQGELANILKSTPQELYPTATDAYMEATLRRTRENYAEALKQLDKNYNIVGMYGSGEHLQAKADLQEELARTESAVSADIEQRRFELARTAKYQALQDALNIDKATMDDLVGLTALDVETAARIYGANVADVKAIRDALGTLGVETILRGGGYSPSLGTLNIKMA